MILVIDNYDSFTYNLVQYLGELGAELVVYRNDKIDLDGIEHLEFDHIVISPGPGTPDDAGISMDVIRAYQERVPILGVCLGHQCIGQVYGGKIIGAARLMHGKTSLIKHDESDLYTGVENPFEATRYHSLILERATCPDCLEINAWTDQDEIMGIHHGELPVWGVQFHPESILTDPGKRVLGNFLAMEM